MFLQIVKLVVDLFCLVGLVATIYLLLKMRFFRVEVVVKVFGNDTAHVGPWTTVRSCLDCGALITGGPTRCVYCADSVVESVRQLKKELRKEGK